MLELKIKTGGAAFCCPISGEPDKHYEAAECARILRDVAEQLESGYRAGREYDINGNSVCKFELR